MKYITPKTELHVVEVALPLAESVAMHDDENDPVVDNPDEVLSRRKQYDVWDDDEEEQEQ